MVFATEFPLNRFLVQLRVVLICALAAWLTACGGGGGDAAPASMNNVPAPVAPEADAGGDRSVMRGSDVTVDGTASSDSDGSIVSFAWTQTAGPTVTLTNADQTQLSFTAPNLADPTDLEFELTVTNNDGLSASDSVTITVVPQTFSISVAASTDTDSDVNDPIAAYQPNDSPATAQSISNPVTLGGYVNRPGFGESGRSQSSGDVSDFYRVVLVAGETITLLVAEPAVGDIGLFLWNASGTEILNMPASRCPEPFHADAIRPAPAFESAHPGRGFRVGNRSTRGIAK